MVSRLPLILAVNFLLMIAAPAQSPAPTALKLPAIIADHMVLQNGQEDTLWGWAAAGTPVKAEFLDAQGHVLVQASGVTSAAGQWSLKLPSLPSGTAGQLRFTAGTETKIVQDVLVGETWICGGQSNMTYDFGSDNMERSQVDAAKMQATKENGAIRIFLTFGASAETPQENNGEWFVVTPDRIGGGTFCVAWYFAVALREKVQQPFGLIECAVGGTRAEQWMSKEAVAALPHGPELMKQQLDAAAQMKPKHDAGEAAYAIWLKANPTPEMQQQNRAGAPQRFGMPAVFSDLYNGMLHGLQPYGARGVIWFQADGNLGATPIYGELIQGLIKNWRADFQADLPFYYVEMNNMRDDVQVKPVQFNELSQLREAQDGALALPKTDVVSSIDCGLPEPEPHFPDKEPVGRRLALLALNYVYGSPCVCHSPTYQSSAVEGSTLRIKFTDANGLRVRGGGQMKGFAIRGATGDWVWAQGKVDGPDVVLWSDQVPQPAAARYAWAANPITSMENADGLPMRPFRTDKDSPQ
jgi:sialate O-acetylesterase